MTLAPCESMGTCEVVRVRLFDTNDGPRVIRVFQQSSGSLPPGAAVVLYRSPSIGNDWSICFWRSRPESPEIKSSEAAWCAEVLRSIGLVDHSIWWQEVMGNSPDQRMPREGEHPTAPSS